MTIVNYQHNWPLQSNPPSPPAAVTKDVNPLHELEERVSYSFFFFLVVRRRLLYTISTKYNRCQSMIVIILKIEQLTKPK
jgi:hypothetical protein